MAEPRELREQIFGQWNALQAYFNSHEDYEKPERAKRCAERLRDYNMHVHLQYLGHALRRLNTFNTYPQVCLEKNIVIEMIIIIVVINYLLNGILHFSISYKLNSTNLKTHYYKVSCIFTFYIYSFRLMSVDLVKYQSKWTTYSSHACERTCHSKHPRSLQR